jgi:L-amino acid N-acyltransferase YncA
MDPCILLSMSAFRARAPTPADLDVVRGLCIAATARGTLYAHRQPRLDPEEWLAKRAPTVVVEEGAVAVGFAAALAENVPLGAPRCAELLVFVSPSCRRRGAARVALHDLLVGCRMVGLWKLVAQAWPEDVAAKGFLDREDFRVVGTLVKHVQLESGWHDVVSYERLVMAARRSLPSMPAIS